MKVFTVVGVSKISGTSKKSGKPFSMTRLHMTYEDPADKSLVGKGVQVESPFDHVFQNSGYEPVVGDKVHLFYEPNFKGEAELVLLQPVK